MPYSAIAYRLLVSCPSDVPWADLVAVTEAVAHWNASYGRQFAAVVVPLHWSVNAVAEHGARPQAVLNEQLVDDADVVIALFWSRLGSPTGEEASGSVEELEEALKRGAYGAILRCERNHPADVDTEQLSSLREYLGDAEARSLILGYKDEGELGRHVGAILNRAVSHDHGRVEAGAAATSWAQVWPRVERSESVDTDSKGRIKTKTRWALVLSNTGSQAAHGVNHRLEPEQDGDLLPQLLSDARDLETLAPGAEATYPLAVFMQVADQARCVVTWTDSAGEHENSATVRFF